MTDIGPRRTLQELRTLHELEPNQSSVITEGPFDQSLIRWYLSAAGLETVPVYEVDSFDVPSVIVTARGLENSNRGRVIAVAAECADLATAQVVCIVDRDFDAILKLATDQKLLVVTDYSCIEMYAFNEQALNKCVLLHRARIPGPAATVLRVLTPMLHALFLFRAANYALSWNMESVSWLKSASFERDAIAFDEADYLKRYLQKNGRAGYAAVLIDKLSELRGRLQAVGEARLFINGHDFVGVLGWYLRHYKSSWKLQESPLRDALISCTEYAGLRGEPMFASLEDRLRG